MEKLFHYLSKMIVIFPLIIIVVTLLIYFNKNYIRKNSYTSLVAPTLFPSASSEAFGGLFQKTSSAEGKFDLNGPLQCNYSMKTSSVSAYIKNSKIFVEKTSQKKQTHFLLNGDCFYLWEKGKFSGDKICGMKQIMPFLSMFSSFGLSNIESILNYLPQNNLIEIGQIDKTEIDNFIKSCKRRELTDKVFELPTNVLFKIKSMAVPTASPQ